MLNQTKNLLIGLFVVVACGLIVGIILFIEPSIGDGKQTLNIRFSNINGITVGTRVTFAGKPIGEVTKIQTIPQARSQPVDALGQLFFYQLECHIDSHIKVYTTDEISVQTSGLLGEKSIAIIPKTAPPGVTPQLVTAAHPVYANSEDPIQSAFNTISVLATKVEDGVDVLIDWVHTNGAALGKAVRSFDFAMEEFGQTMESINKSQVICQAYDTLQSIQCTSDTIQSVVASMDDNQVFDNLADIMRNLRGASFSIEDILKDIEDGKGTLGKLITDEDFYLRVMNILSKVDTTLNDVNHYGILFNLNKEWQRTRQKHVTELNALKTPNQFKDYYEKEMDLINTAVSRLSMLIDKAEQSPNKDRILQNPLYKKDFAEFLRLVNDLLNTLKLYNEQLEESRQGVCNPS